MKTTVENLLLIEDSKIDKKYSNSNITIVIIYEDNNRKIFYRFHKNSKYEPDAFIDDEDSLTDIHFFETIEDVLNQVFYITGKKIKLKND